MFTIRTRIALAALLTVPAVATPELAFAKVRTLHNYSSAIHSEPLSTGNGYPSPGGTLLSTGTVEIRPFGAGALVDHVRITGHPAANTFDFVGTEVDYFNNGTWRANLAGTDALQPDGSQRVSVTGQFTGGTGRYAGLGGLFIYTGSVPTGATALTGHSSGWVTY